MYSHLYEDPSNELLKDRLARLADEIRGQELHTQDEYQAEVYSQVNRILALGVGMQPLDPILAEGPAEIGDVGENLHRLNQDAADIAKQILRVEDITGQLYNLAAATQNAIRQQIREQAYTSNARRFLEGFLHKRQLDDTTTASLDFMAGVALLPVLQSTKLAPQIDIGSNSVGEVVSGPEALTDGQIDTVMAFAGTSLELIIRLNPAQVVNRLVLELDDYQGLEIVSLSSSPDGTLYEDILADLAADSVHLNGLQSKFSGDFVLDFPPRYVSKLRLVVEDRAGEAYIAFRNLELYSTTYSPTGTIVTQPVVMSAGSVIFTTDELSASPLTSISHQMSYNGVHYSSITPGDTITLSNPTFFYRAILERAEDRFNSNDAALESLVNDPLQNPDYVLTSSASTQMGNNLLERVLVFSTITGPVKLRETALPATLQIRQGGVLLTTASYTYLNGVLAFDTPVSNVTVTYQTSALGQAALAKRKDYYTPLLYQVAFQRA